MIFYAYFGYPICLFVISVFKKKSNHNNYELKSESYKPLVTFIITAYNEEKRIRKKIEDTLSQDYPKEKLEIIVASDCSTDRTDEIVKSYKKKNITLVRASERKGKENAQKYAVDSSSGEILVFSDVATFLKPNGISNIVKNFQDSAIGCVSSEDKFVDEDGKISGEGAYVKYEMFLRNLESRVNTLVGLSGSFFAARKEVCEDWAPDIQSDFNTLMNSVKLGLRGVSDPQSIGYYQNIVDEKKEFDRKVRTVLRGIHVFMRNIPLLNPIRHGLFSWQLFSHKLCRWLVPFFMIVAFFSNAAAMFTSAFLFLLFILQLSLYSLSSYYYKHPKHMTCSAISSINNSKIKNQSSISSIARLSYYFVSVNLSILAAWWRFIRGEKTIFWTPSER